MGRNKLRLAGLVVTVLAAIGHFSYFGIGNDHFDRLSRARQIAFYGDVPFRDFFDPGYFFTLYVSAFLIRIVGDNLLGEVLLNMSFFIAATVVVFVLAARTSRSLLYGFLAAAFIVASQPRGYDYDKMLFFPLGLYVCWKYIETPVIGWLVASCGVTVIAGMFRYDSAVYLGASLLVGIVVRHWGDSRRLVARLAATALIVTVFAAPTLVFIQSTAGLQDAFAQILTYATHEGERSNILISPRFELDSSRGPIRSIVSPDNSASVLYFVTLAFVVLSAFILPIFRRNREAPAMAKLLSFATMTALVTIFILREPVSAHIAGAIPLIAVGAALLIDQWRVWLQPVPGAGTSTPGRRLAIASAGILVLSLLTANITALIEVPRSKNIEFGRRLREYSETPVSLNLLPKSAFEPLVEYLRSCTSDSDRVLVGWFGAEVFFFSGRGFAAGLPEVFGTHWNGLKYQRRSLQLMERQSVPIIVTMTERPITDYTFLWDFVEKKYRLAYEGVLSQSPPLQFWVRRDRPVERQFGEYALPCYAPALAPGASTQ